jgi:hypothetical protein
MGPMGGVFFFLSKKIKRKKKRPGGLLVGEVVCNKTETDYFLRKKNQILEKTKLDKRKQNNRWKEFETNPIVDRLYPRQTTEIVIRERTAVTDCRIKRIRWLKFLQDLI